MNSREYFVEEFKIKTLDELNKKKENFFNYKIEINDILKINSCNVCGSQDLTLISEVYLNKKFVFNATSSCNNCFLANYFVLLY